MPSDISTVRRSGIFLRIHPHLRAWWIKGIDACFKYISSESLSAWKMTYDIHLIHICTCACACKFYRHVLNLKLRTCALNYYSQLQLVAIVLLIKCRFSSLLFNTQTNHIPLPFYETDISDVTLVSTNDFCHRCVRSLEQYVEITAGQRFSQFDLGLLKPDRCESDLFFLLFSGVFI